MKTLANGKTQYTAKELQASIDAQTNFVGAKFSTDGDRKISFKIIRRIKSLSYIPGIGYTVKTDENGNNFEIKFLKYDSRLPFIPNAGSSIGKYGKVWHVRVSVISDFLCK